MPGEYWDKMPLMNKLSGFDRQADYDRSWWTIYTRHQHEAVVSQHLTMKGFEVFLPVYDSVRQWKDRKKTISLPVFPCYVFVRGGLDRKLAVVTTPGVHMILHCGDRVAIIPEEEIQAIQRSMEGHIRVEPHPFLKCGERVRVKRGALEGVEGILVRKKNQSRLILSVNMISQSVAMEIDVADVEPIVQRSAMPVTTPDLRYAYAGSSESYQD